MMGLLEMPKRHAFSAIWAISVCWTFADIQLILIYFLQIIYVLYMPTESGLSLSTYLLVHSWSNNLINILRSLQNGNMTFLFQMILYTFWLSKSFHIPCIYKTYKGRFYIILYHSQLILLNLIFRIYRHIFAIM